MFAFLLQRKRADTFRPSLMPDMRGGSPPGFAFWPYVQFLVGAGVGQDAGMGSVKKPKDPPPPPPPLSTTGADVAQEKTAARKKERSRYDFSKTILRSGGMMGSALPEGTKSTLG